MKNILLLQTGGTIAMNIADDGNPRLDVAHGTDMLYREIPELSEVAAIDIISPFFEDSSDVGPQHWATLIQTIRAHYHRYDGFVILHGTDTMAYTASALSFGMQQLGKPVIMTGSQVPMKNIRSDARRNLINAIEIATMPLPEVAVCFNDHVYRGNRSTKMSIGDFNAFASPNYPPLAEIGLHISLNKNLCRTVAEPDSLVCADQFSEAVFMLKIYPGLSASMLEGFDLSQFKVLVIETFGSGNFPQRNGHSLIPFLKQCVDEDIVLVFTSQAPYDSVDLSKYESGRQAAALGAVSAGDMTTEATLTKIMYLLHTCSSPHELKQQIQTNIAGELTI